MEKEFVELYLGIYKELYRYAYYILGEKSEAEDAVSEAVLDAYKGFSNLRDRTLFKNWMFTILSVKCKRRLKSYINRPQSLEGEDFEWNEGDISEYGKVEVRSDLAGALELIGEPDKSIVLMTVIGEMSSKEVGEALEMNHNTVRTRQKRALQKLRNILEGNMNGRKEYSYGR